MVRVGIVGYGYAGRVIHSRLIGSVDGLSLTAVASRSPERRRQAQEDWSVATYETIEDLLSDPNVDVVIIATPHQTHHRLALLSIEAGKATVVDKPLTITVEEAEDLLRVAREKGVLFTVFQNRRWDWDFLTVQKVFKEGVIGPFWWMESSVGRFGPTRGWRSERGQMGSLLHDWGVHLMDQVFLLMGRPQSLRLIRHFRRWGGDVESFVRVQMEWNDGRTAVVEVNYLRAAEKPRWYVLGDDGGLVITGLDPQEKALREGNIDAAPSYSGQKATLFLARNGQVICQALPLVQGDWRDFYRNLRDVLEGKAELAVPAEECVEVLRLIQAALASTGR
ncbi:MAG: Gfo/Idh/MocA family oxidoreductase [Armatimonadetes bacterium]|nr:Gfo/Idh/MocA family oxidoreductase [Armatimonadota bacterium]MDW8122938.1 Gfo/Idh/MocA family oxidoreductase [Armatimonadota bacterium]